MIYGIFRIKIYLNKYLAMIILKIVIFRDKYLKLFGYGVGWHR